MKTFFDEQNDFFRAMGSPSIRTHTIDECVALGANLIAEEVIAETIPALEKYRKNPTTENLAEVADGLVDSVYVLLHTANSLDIPFNRIWEEVHHSNMRKLNPDGSVTRREDGKILKPDGWTPPNIFQILVDKESVDRYGPSYMTKGMVT